MKIDLKTVLLSIFIIISLVLGGLLLRSPRTETITKTRIDTVYVDVHIIDSVPYPIVDTRYITRVDTLVQYIYDSIPVYFPIEISTQEWTGRVDSLGTYIATVEGFSAKLKGIEFDLRIPSVNTYVEVSKRKRWNLGIQAGIGPQYGLINKQWDVGPYIGLGLMYSF